MRDADLASRNKSPVREEPLKDSLRPEASRSSLGLGKVTSKTKDKEKDKVPHLRAERAYMSEWWAVVWRVVSVGAGCVHQRTLRHPPCPTRPTACEELPNGFAALSQSDLVSPVCWTLARFRAKVDGFVPSTQNVDLRIVCVPD